MMSFVSDCLYPSSADSDEYESLVVVDEQRTSDTNHSSEYFVQDELISALKSKDFDVQKIKEMITVANINSRDKFQNSVLHLAVERIDNQNDEHISFIEHLIYKGADVRSRNNCGDTPFLWVAKNNKYRLIDLFADNNKNEVNAQNKDLCTALHLAVQENNCETVAKLHWLSETHGLNEELVNRVGDTPKKIAESSNRGINKKIFNILNDEPKEFLDTNTSSTRNLSISMLDAAGDQESIKLQESSTGVTINVSEGGTAIIGTNQININPSKETSYQEQICEKSSEKIASYPMTRIPRGICLILVNEKFEENSKLDDRTGCYTDVENLEKTFKMLKFTVKIKKNLQALSMYNKLLKYAKYNHENFDCFVLCILSHGCTGAIYGVDGKKLPIRSIQMLFCGDHCKSLADKPKLFFLNACRTLAKDGHDDDKNSCSSKASRPKHPLTDFLMAYSCPDGFPSWRVLGADSWYITALSEALQQYAQTEELQHILTKVNDKVSHQMTEHGYMQIPSPVNQLTKKLWFFPGNR